MSAPGRYSWFGTAIFIGVLYCLIGIVFAWPSNQVRMWRLAAWIISAVLYAAHIGYEHFRVRNSRPATSALHTAMAVAVGAFGLAVAANFHEVWVASSYRRSLALALVAWPVLTGLPAFLVALIAAYGLALTRRSS
jgi:hypothetical protein